MVLQLVVVINVLCRQCWQISHEVGNMVVVILLCVLGRHGLDPTIEHEPEMLV